MTPEALRKLLTDRIRNLQDQRAEILQKSAQRVALIDARLVALQGLAGRFDSLTLVEAIVALDNAGLVLEFKQS